MKNNLIEILLFPVRWFWIKYNQCKEEGNIIKILFLFIISFSGIALIGVALIWSIVYLFTYYPEWVVFAGLVAWLYVYVKSKMFPNPVEPIMAPQIMEPNRELLLHKANVRLDMITNIMFACIKEVAPKIKCVSPDSESEIIDIDKRIDIEDNVVFYVFRFEKEDYHTTYDDNMLNNAVATVQYKLNHMISSSKFRLYGFPTECDAFNECLNGICIDDILDNQKQYLYAWVTFDTPEYKDFLYRENMKQSSNCIDTALPNASWDDDADV